MTFFHTLSVQECLESFDLRKYISCLFPNVWSYESSTRTNSIEFVSDVMSPWDSVFSDLYYTLGSESSVGLISALRSVNLESKFWGQKLNENIFGFLP